MKKFENMGFTTKVSNGKLTIEIPVKNLVMAFENMPDYEYPNKVKKGKHTAFAEFCAEHIIAECDQEDGSNYLHKAFDQMFELLIEGYEDGSDFIAAISDDSDDY